MLPSDWTSARPESAWYQHQDASGVEVCRTDAASFLASLVDELSSRLASMPSSRPPLDWTGAMVTDADLPLIDQTHTGAWSLGVLRALYVALMADGASAVASAVLQDAARRSISQTTLRAAIWETIPSEVRDAVTGSVLPAINPSTGARRRAPGNTVAMVRLPPSVVLPAFDSSPPAPVSGVVGGMVCGPPTPDRDLAAAPEAVPFIGSPTFWLLLGVTGLLLASAITQHGPKIGKFDPSKKRKW